MTDLTITPGSTVLIAGFDDIPAHQFLVEVVNMIGLHDDCYHYRGLKILSFGRLSAAPSSSQVPDYPSTQTRIPP